MSAPQLPGVFATLAPVLDHYGYLVVGGTLFIQNLGWPVSLGQSMFIAGAVYAGAGRLNIVVLSVVAVVVSVAGGALGYLIGRSGGRALVHRYGRYVFLTGERLAQAEAFFARRGAFVIIIARFVAVVRHIFSLVAGITGMPFLRFVLCNTLGALLWIGPWAAIGYLAGRHITPVYDRATRYSLYLLIALLVVTTALVVRYLVRRRRASAARAAAAEPGPAQD